MFYLAGSCASKRTVVSFVIYPEANVLFEHISSNISIYRRSPLSYFVLVNLGSGCVSAFRHRTHYFRSRLASMASRVMRRVLVLAFVRAGIPVSGSVVVVLAVLAGNHIPQCLALVSVPHLDCI